MFKEVLKVNDGVTYEHSETILLLDIWDVEGKPKQIERAIRFHYTINGCQHSHDCCGCWRTSVTLVAFDSWRAIVHLLHTQNV